MAGTIFTAVKSRKAAGGAFSKQALGVAGVDKFLLIFDSPKFEPSVPNHIHLQGVDANNLAVQLADSVILTVVSSNTNVLQIGNQSGLPGFDYALVAPGTANITITVTWRSGSPGPFTITIPVTVMGTAQNELRLCYGTITIV